jgi:hypothetical protein
MPFHRTNRKPGLRMAAFYGLFFNCKGWRFREGIWGIKKLHTYTTYIYYTINACRECSLTSFLFYNIILDRFSGSHNDRLYRDRSVHSSAVAFHLDRFLMSD